MDLTRRRWQQHRWSSEFPHSVRPRCADSRGGAWSLLLSKDTRKLEEERERTYFATLAAAPAEVKLCKLADVYDNLLDCQGMPAAARAKMAEKARTLLSLFSDDLRTRWPHVLSSVADLLARASAP
jgi:hypothetical protein